MAAQFDGKVALVTGGNAGIGKATALQFAREGARVVIAARRADAGEQTVSEIRDAGGEAIFVRTDVSRTDDVKNMVDTAVSTYGRLDYAFNNAGIVLDRGGRTSTRWRTGTRPSASTSRACGSASSTR